MSITCDQAFFFSLQRRKSSRRGGGHDFRLECLGLADPGVYFPGKF